MVCAVGQQPHFIRRKVLNSAHVCAQPAEGASTRIVRKQAELIEKLQRQFATLESRFVDYQEAQAAMAQVCFDSKTAGQSRMLEPALGAALSAV